MLRWVKTWIANVAMLNERFRNEDGTVDFEALGREEYAFRQAIITGDTSRNERARIALDEAETEYVARSEAGKRNIAKRWGRTEKQPEQVRAVSPIPSWEEFLSFVDGEGLDYSDAREWWEMSIVDRAGKDRFGNPIGNWKGACKRFCGAKKKGRG